MEREIAGEAYQSSVGSEMRAVEPREVGEVMDAMQRDWMSVPSKQDQVK